jgi:hypothetical protein
MLIRRLQRLRVPINLAVYVLSAPKFFDLRKSSAAERLLILNQATRHWGAGTVGVRTLPAFGSRNASAD